jgi:hypothetical protein
VRVLQGHPLFLCQLARLGKFANQSERISLKICNGSSLFIQIRLHEERPVGPFLASVLEFDNEGILLRDFLVETRGLIRALEGFQVQIKNHAISLRDLASKFHRPVGPLLQLFL